MAKYTLVHGIRIAKDFTPETFGRLATLGPAFLVGRTSYQVCECRCGNVVAVLISNAKSGRTKSCGCLYNAKNERHGLSSHSLYKTWENMNNRCYNPNNPNFKNYGGRGIAVCDRWRNSFASFLEDMGECPVRHSLDRIDNSRGYFKENCRWATKIEQNNNTRSNRTLIHNGKTQTLMQWSRELGFAMGTIKSRLRSGWTVERALTEPIHVEKSSEKQK